MAERAGTGRRRPHRGPPRRAAKREVPRSLGSGGRGVRGGGDTCFFACFWLQIRRLLMAIDA